MVVDVEGKQMSSRIDVHHHVLPPEYISMLHEIGVTESYGHPLDEWRRSPEQSIRFMQRLAIDKAIVSISTPGVYFRDDELSGRLARVCNDYIADLKRDHPGIFGGFASVPLPDVTGALAELEYALDELGLDGVSLMTNYKGSYLGDSSFNEFFEELDRRKAVVFIHPTDPADAYDPELGISNSIIEAPFETTRAIANMLYTGQADRCPDISFILSHGGGTIPYLGWKIALIRYQQEGKKLPVARALYDFLIKGGPESGLRILRSMYYDTALISDKPAIRALVEFAGNRRIVFGTDFPFAEKLAPIVSKNLKTCKDLSEEDLEAVDHLNSSSLFPTLLNN
jgi:predicted TIM-barrel fold metal-dependent hydrolase